MNARFSIAIAVVSGLGGAAIGVLRVAINHDSAALLALGAVSGAVAIVGLVALGRALVLEDRDRGSYGGK